MITQFQLLWVLTRVGFQTIRGREERGSTVETVVLTAVFAALAIAVGAIIVTKVTAKAHSVNLN
jgi:hypothetical protein